MCRFSFMSILSCCATRRSASATQADCWQSTHAELSTCSIQVCRVSPINTTGRAISSSESWRKRPHDPSERQNATPEDQRLFVCVCVCLISLDRMAVALRCFLPRGHSAGVLSRHRIGKDPLSFRMYHGMVWSLTSGKNDENTRTLGKPF